VKWIEEVKDWVDKPITGDEARWLRIAGLVLMAPFVALVVAATAAMAAGAVFAVVLLVVCVVQHAGDPTTWLIVGIVLVVWAILAVVVYHLEGA
jgi:hypothetical protein